MSSIIKREGERNVRSNDFLQEGKTDFAAKPFAVAQIALLNTKVAESAGARTEQTLSDDAARQQYAVAAQAEADLKEMMDEWVDFILPLGDEIEGIEEKFRKPRTGGKRARIARARIFAREAAPYEATLTGRGMDDDFIALLEAKADALENALSSAVLNTASRVGAVDTALLAHREANKIIKTLDPIVRKIYKNNPAKLAAWKFASHVRRDDEPEEKTPQPQS